MPIPILPTFNIVVFNDEWAIRVRSKVYRFIGLESIGLVLIFELKRLGVIEKIANKNADGDNDIIVRIIDTPPNGKIISTNSNFSTH